MLVRKSMKGKEILKILFADGWRIIRWNGGSHRIISKPGHYNYCFAYKDNEEVGSRCINKLNRELSRKL